MGKKVDGDNDRDVPPCIHHPPATAPTNLLPGGQSAKITGQGMRGG